MIKLRTLGESVIEIGAERLGPDSDALFAALLYLTAERGRRITRTSFAELLWPDFPADRGRHCLRQLLYRLRMIGVVVDSNRETILLPEPFVTPTFSASPSAERLVAERAAGTLRIGPYLPGYAPRISQPFAEWLDAARAAVESKVRRVILEVTHAHRLRGQWDDVDGLARECLRIDPLNEEATLAVAEAAAMSGAKTEALAILDRYMADIGPAAAELRIPPNIMRRRIAERLPNRRYGSSSDDCFVGRGDTMEVLTTAVLRARNADGSAIMLVGPPGIGKTRVVEELTKVSVMQGVRVVRVNVAEVDRERPMAALADAVPQMRALPGAIGVSPDAIRFLDRLTETYPSETAIAADPADPRWVAARIRQSIVDLADAVAAEGTLLLVIEDAHWLDTASWAAVAALLDWLPSKRALLLLTSRGPHPSSVTPDRCRERVTAKSLPPLDSGASLQLVRAIGSSHDDGLTDAALRWCVDVGDGNPFFLRELAAHCLGGGRTNAVPPSLEGLLDQRISRLSPTSRHVLHATTTLGAHATPERVCAMLGLPAHEILTAIEDLAREHVLSESSATVSIRHHLLASRIVDRLPDVARAWLNQRAALTLTHSTAIGRSVEHLIAIAQHWQAAGDLQKAIDTLIEAARAVQRIGEVANGVELLEVALAIGEGSGHRARVLRLLNRLLALKGDWDRILAACKALLAFPDVDERPTQRALDAVAYIDARYRAGHDPIELIGDCYCLVRDARLDPQARLVATRQGLIIAINQSADAEALDLWTAAEAPAALVDTDDAVAITLRLIYQVSFGDMRRGLAEAQRLRDRARSELDSYDRLVWLANVAYAYDNVGLLLESVDSNLEVVEEARRAGSLYHERRAYQRLSTALIRLGDVESARIWMGALDRMMEGATDEWQESSRAEDIIRLAIIEGAYAAALEDAERLLARVAANPHPVSWIVRDSLTVYVDALLRANDGPVPETVLVDLERVHATMCKAPAHDETAATLYSALMRTERQDDARAMLARYLAFERRSLAPWTGPQTFPTVAGRAHEANSLSQAARELESLTRFAPGGGP